MSIPPTVPYVLTHGLGIAFPRVTIYLDIPGQYIVVNPDIFYIDPNNIAITHAVTTA